MYLSDLGTNRYTDSRLPLRHRRRPHVVQSSKSVAANEIKDPEGILGPPQTGHIARREFKRQQERHAEGREAFQKQILEEKQRRIALRQSRVVSDTSEELIDNFLDTGAQEIEFEIARLRPRLFILFSFFALRDCGASSPVAHVARLHLLT